MRLALAACLLTPLTALAHAHLQSAAPPAGSTVVHAPPALTLNFSEGVEPRFSKVAVTDANGTRLDQGTLQVDPQANTALLVPLKPLPPGDYTVTWQAVSVDTHHTKGTYHFKVSGP